MTVTPTYDDLQEEIAPTRKLKSISILAEGIAHDFNNLLSVILGNISIATEDLKGKHSVLGFLKQAEKASHRAKDLANQLITFSRGEIPLKKTAPVIELIKDVIDLALADTGVSCNFSAPDDPFRVEYDPNQIKSAIVNVIYNSLEAMEKDGTLSVKAKNLTIKNQNQEPGLLIDKGRYVKLSIKDDGVGIPEKNLPLIFDPYFSTKKRGLKKGIGLGLATTYSVIRKHGGHIRVESQEGTGSTFHIYLPADDNRPLERSPSIETSFGKRRKVLVMDDEKMLRDLAAIILKRLFYDVELAENSEEAVSLYKKAMDDAEPFDAVILDLTTGDGMGGQKTVKSLIEIDPNVKAIISSGYFNDPVMTNFKNYGFCDAMVKPYRIDDLKFVLNKTFNLDV